MKQTVNHTLLLAVVNKLPVNGLTLKSIHIHNSSSRHLRKRETYDRARCMNKREAPTQLNISNSFTFHRAVGLSGKVNCYYRRPFIYIIENSTLLYHCAAKSEQLLVTLMYCLMIHRAFTNSSQ